MYITAVIAQCFSEGEFRLANPSTNFTSDGSVITTGRIEVCSNFTYASLCSQYWDQVDAQVFCENYLNSIGYYSNISKFSSYSNASKLYQCLVLSALLCLQAYSMPFT